MAYEIIWSAEARLTYIAIIEYLEKDWTEREIIKFANSVHDKLNLLSVQPFVGSYLNKQLNIRRTSVHKHTSLVYSVRRLKKEIVIVTFWDTRKDPGKLKVGK